MCCGDVVESGVTGALGTEKYRIARNEIMSSKNDTLTKCWFNVGPLSVDTGPTLNQHWVQVSCLLD